MAADVLAQKILEKGLLGRSSAVRTDDLARRVFARRYLLEEGAPARYLKHLVEKQAAPPVVRQLMLVYTARLHTILRDFIAEVYWSRYAAGAETISRTDAEDFIEHAHADRRIAPPWSETMKLRVARYLTGTLADFGLVEDVRQSAKPLRPYRLLPETTLFLAHEIHFKGFNDNSILEAPDWKLFGLVRSEVVQELDRISREGHFIVQYSGDLLRIAWRYRTMEECLDAIAGR